MLISAEELSLIPLTWHSASKKDRITAAEEESPPIGKEPSITPQRPTVSGNRLLSAQVAPRR